MHLFGLIRMFIVLVLVLVRVRGGWLGSSGGFRAGLLGLRAGS